MFKKFEEYAMNKSYRYHITLTLILFVSYSCIIAFGFTSFSQKIAESGFSTSDLQESISRIEVGEIVNAWEPFLFFVNMLYLFDYLFIIVGLFLFFSMDVILLKYFKNKGNYQIIPKLGIILTTLSRTFDALENLFTILIYSNPANFNMLFLQLLIPVSLIKWIFVSVEYSVMLIGWLFVIILKIRSKNQ